MIELRPQQLGSADTAWLKAKHHFSFGSHYDPANMAMGLYGCGTTTKSRRTPAFQPTPHPHGNHHLCREGAITHQDSLGNKGRTEAGDVQVMSAGSGVRHSEYNLEPAKTKIFQIWIEPTTQAGRRHGAPSRFRSRIVPATSSPSPADSKATRTRCRSVPTRGCSPPP